MLDAVIAFLAPIPYAYRQGERYGINDNRTDRGRGRSPRHYRGWEGYHHWVCNFAPSIPPPGRANGRVAGAARGPSSAFLWCVRGAIPREARSHVIGMSVKVMHIATGEGEEERRDFGEIGGETMVG